MQKLLVADFNGTPVKHYLVEPLSVPAAAPQVTPSHHVIVVDRSGSMYYTIPELRAMVEKLLTLTEFRDPNQRVSLISYSSSGDVKLHFARVTVEDVMAASSPYVKEIRALASTGLTCISQALTLAASIVNAGEATMVSLHSDGYANHLSPGAEARAIDAAMDKIQGLGNVVVNTIAYSSYCDFTTLDRVANRGGGVCVRAQTIAGVYDALYNTQRTLAGAMVPAAKFAVENGDYVVAFSRKGLKILGSEDDLVIRGLSGDADVQGFRFREVTAVEYAASSALPATTSVVCAFARTLLALGDILTAKYVVSGAGYRNLLGSHYRALTSSALGDFASALDDVVFSGVSLASEGPGLGFSGPTVLGTLGAIAANYDGVLVNLPSLRSVYSRRGVKKVAGTRNADGSITAPSTKLVARADEWVKVGIEFNNSEATAQMQVALDADLVDTDGKRIAEVSGVVLNKLKSYANYTVISDGVVNVPVIRVRVVTKSAYAALSAAGHNLGAYDPNAVHELELGKMAVTDFGAALAMPSDTFSKLLRLTVCKKIGDGIAKALKAVGDGTDYTAEQIAALKAVNITAAGYYSAPTTVPYTSLEDAVNAGAIDYRTTYQVVLANTKILGVADLYSANEYLQRRFTLSIETDGKREDVKKPTFDAFFNPTAVWGVKKLTAATKLNPVDDVMYPVMEAVLGLSQVPSEIAGFRNRDTVLTTLADIDAQIEDVYARWIRPLVVYTASTGIVPSSLNLTAMTPDEFSSKYNMKVGKDAADGTFFVGNDGTVLAVYPKLKPFSTAPLTADDE